MPKETERVIVTTGGTKEPIDSVRFITNFSTGRFGYEIASQMAQQGYSVNLLCPSEVQRQHPTYPQNLEFTNFTSTESLQKALLSPADSPVIIVHSAAVSDYTVENPVDGKISSSLDRVTINLIKTPKIIDKLRDFYGKESFLVGFKLLSGVSRNELIDVAQKQNHRAHLNLTVANDLTQIHDGQHPVILVTPEGGAIDIFGSKSEVAQKFIEFVKKRSFVDWYHTEKLSEDRDIPESEKEKFSSLLEFAQTTGLLYDTSGNASMRCGSGLLASPRQVDKSKIDINQACYAEVDHQTQQVFYLGENKSSIDTAVNHYLYQKYPQIKYLIHFHQPWGVAEDITDFPYPCGVKQEAIEISRHVDNLDHQHGFCLELTHHGFLLGLTETDLDRLKNEWQQNLTEFKQHLVSVGQENNLDKSIVKPIFSGNRIVGAVMQNELGIVVYLGEMSRGRGIGKKIIQQLIDRQIPIQTINQCGVVDYYKNFGFTETIDPNTGFHILHPPIIQKTDSLFDRINDWKIVD
jgi:hypothetical protein